MPTLAAHRGVKLALACAAFTPCHRSSRERIFTLCCDLALRPRCSSDCDIVEGSRLERQALYSGTAAGRGGLGVMFSHHSHSGQFCAHAKGSLEDVVLEAIRQGFTTYALTEHMPRYRADDLYPEEIEACITVDDLTRTFDAFLDEAERLRAKYADRITLLVGAETESLPRADLDRFLARHAGRLELLVGSVHHVRSIPIDFDRATFDRAVAAMPGDTRGARLAALVGEYLDEQYALLEHVRPAVVGHFDVVKLFEPDFDLRADPAVWARVERNVRYAVGYGALFEVNASAFRKGWRTAYPGPDVLRLITSLDGHLTLSDDSHGPHAVGLHYDDARRYLADEGVSQLWMLARGGDGRGARPVPVGGRG